MKRFVSLVLLLAAALIVSAAKVKRPGPKTYAYRYQLVDKRNNSYTTDKPQRFLSRKSLERRQRQGLAID